MKDNQEFDKPWWLLPVGRVNPWWWVAAGAAFVAFDYMAGGGTQFPTLYVVPVAFAAWYSGATPAVALGVGVPLFHIMLLTQRAHTDHFMLQVVMTMVRSAFISVLALWFARLSEHERQLHRYIGKLEGLLPICSFCKSIRNETGDWETLEVFISERSDADFSHGLCPDCLREHYSH